MLHKEVACHDVPCSIITRIWDENSILTTTAAVAVVVSVEFSSERRVFVEFYERVRIVANDVPPTSWWFELRSGG